MGAVAEKIRGMYSALFLNWFTECARKMSNVRKATFRIAKSSIQIWGRPHQRSLSLAMLPPKLGGHGLELDCFLQHGIVAMPLHKVGASHKGAVLAGASVVVPEIEINEIDRVRERRAAERAVFAQGFNQIPCG